MKNYRIIKASDGAVTGTFHLIDVLDDDTTIASITPSTAIAATDLTAELLPRMSGICIDFTGIELSAGRIGTYDR